MRRLLLLLFGVLELAVAGLLVQMGAQLPAPAEVEESFARAEAVTRQAGRQIHQVRDQVRTLRQPQLEEHVGRLQEQLRTVAGTLRDRSIDFETVAATRDALGNVAKGLRGLGDSLDPEGVARLGEGLKVAADFLEGRVIPAADDAAEQLEKAAALLEEDARLVSRFLKEAPADFDALRQVHDGLAKFDAGLGKLGATLDTERLKAMRDGFAGMHESLTTGAGQVERLAGYTYPAVTVDGLRVEVEQRPFWPAGGRIAGGLRQAGKGVKAADEQMAELIQSLPELQESLRASRKVVAATRQTLAGALEQRERVEPVLKELPGHAARLADDLPKLGQNLARVLRQAKELKDVAVALRQAHDGLKETSASWPEVRQALLASAKVLQTTREQLDQALRHRDDYENAVTQTVDLADASATLAPLLTRQTLRQLEEQERSLDELSGSLGEVGAVLPRYGHTAARLVQTGRWLAWLVAAVVALHGVYVLATARRPAHAGGAGR